MKVEYNTKNWPYVRITFHNNTPTDDGFKKHLNNFRHLYKLCEENKSKMIIIFDLRNVPSGSIQYLKQQADFNKEISPLSLKYLEHSLFLTSTIGKHILNLMFAIEKPVAEYTTFSSQKALSTFLINYDKQHIKINNIKTNNTKTNDTETNDTETNDTETNDCVAAQLL